MSWWYYSERSSHPLPASANNWTHILQLADIPPPQSATLMWASPCVSLTFILVSSLADAAEDEGSTLHTGKWELSTAQRSHLQLDLYAAGRLECKRGGTTLNLHPFAHQTLYTGTHIIIISSSSSSRRMMSQRTLWVAVSVLQPPSITTAATSSISGREMMPIITNVKTSTT